MPRNKVSISAPVAHIRRPLSAYGYCGAPAVESTGKPCLECAARVAAYEPQPPIVRWSKDAGKCRDYREVARA
jgi:hypothetical protein